MALDFTGRVVIVTGAAGNLGGAVVHAFAASGAHLVAVDRGTGRLAALFPALTDSPDHLIADAVDLTAVAAVNAMVAAAVKRFGRVDVLVNAAGGYRGGELVHEMDLEGWQFMLALNTSTMLNTCRATIPHMKEQGWGRIINVAARAGLKGSARHAAYSVAKSGVIRLTETMAAELRDDHVTVNCVLPGTIDTPQNRQSMPKANFSRWTEPAAIADVMLLLASDLARAVNGAAISV